jgi:hypothetical protein
MVGPSGPQRLGKACSTERAAVPPVRIGLSPRGQGVRPITRMPMSHALLARFPSQSLDRLDEDSQSVANILSLIFSRRKNLHVTSPPSADRKVTPWHSPRVNQMSSRANARDLTISSLNPRVRALTLRMTACQLGCAAGAGTADSGVLKTSLPSTAETWTSSPALTLLRRISSASGSSR